MKKLIAILLFAYLLFAGNISNIHHNLNNGNWTTTPGIALQLKGVVKSITIQAVGTATRQFLFNDGASAWFKAANTTPIDKGTLLTASTSNLQDINIAVTDQYYYTFNVQNTAGPSAQYAVLETDFNPKTITTVTQSPVGSYVNPNTNLTITATLSAPASTGEKVYARYTTDNWQTSTIVELTNTSGSDYQGTIPGQASGTLQYYILTTKSDLTLTHSNADYFTLQLNNNSGNNYIVNFETKTIYLRGDMNDWGTTAMPMTLRDMGVDNWTKTFQFTGTTGNVNYKFCIDNTNWPNPGNWGAGTTVALATKGTVYVNGNNTVTPMIQNKYYTINFKEVANSSNSEIVVMETDAQPVTITNVNLSSSSVTNNQQASVTVTLSGAKSPQERLYLITSYDNWTTSQANDITDAISGTTATFTFPYLPKNTTVKFYVMTTTKENLTADYDLYTLSYNNNNGANYTLTVTDNGSTTYNNPALAAGAPETVGFRANEKLGTAGTTDYYLTWDAYNIYFAFTGGSHIDNDKYVVMIDVDPNGTNGTSTEFDGVNTTGMQQKPDYVIEVLKYGLPVAKLFKNVDNAWTYVKDLPNYADASNVKIKLPISDLTGATGVSVYQATNPIQFVMFIANNTSKPFTIYPAQATAPDGNTAITANKAVKFASLGTGVVPSTAQSESLLPVEIVANSLKGEVVDNKVILTWATASEINNKGFEVEKLVNNNWQKVGFVKGAGNSNTVRNYKFEDVLTSSKMQYRLKQVDNDGKYSYSDAIEVVYNKKFAYDLKQNYPNPFNPTTKITFELPVKAFAQLKVYNVLGSEVATLINNVVEEGIHTVDFKADNLPAGVYFVTMKANGFSKTIKINLLK